MNTLESKKGNTKIERLLRVIEGKKTALIVGHNNPDPDSIASAMAFQYFLSEIGGIKSDITFGGIIGRAENRALLNYLNLDLHYLEELDPCNYEIIALVDTHVGMGNNPIKSVFPVTIEIDHHPPE
ncbi:MAG TPA: DHH family phosphoesterase, partial [bacterium]